MPEREQDLRPEIEAVWRLANAGRLAEARAASARLVQKAPQDPEAGFAHGVTLLQSGSIDDGIAVLQGVVSTAPHHAGARLNLARALVHAGRREEAETVLRALIAAQPALSAAAMDLAALLARREAAGEAVEVLEEARRHAPRDASLLINLGGLQAGQGDLEGARRNLDAAVALDPQQPLAHYNLGRVQRDLGADEAAARCFRRAVELDPRLDQAWRNLGNALLDLGRVKEAFQAFNEGAKARRTPGGTPSRDPLSYQTSASKLTHDIEQFRYLRARGKLPESFDATIRAYEDTLAALPTVGDLSHVVDIPRDRLPALQASYNRLVVCERSPAVSPCAVNPTLDAEAIEADYARNAPGITFADGFLTAEALEELRRFCLESTFWFEYRYGNGYLGAFFDDGFASPLLYQISEELRLKLPGIFRDHTLRKLWAFKYDSRLSGIPMHADFAAVNVNFWITPDDSNLEPETGGLEVWDKEAPADWDFTKYNKDEAAMRSFLAEQKARCLKVPHRQNRIVVFNSDLFHATGPLHFRAGYEHRRVNITMLYGKREDA
ncbi:MAG: tetratricopeptide repeat protein [Kiloniellales bacterium]|nr:tetratricopeptide repeat protein [Kiloniellales bacterium]